MLIIVYSPKRVNRTLSLSRIFIQTTKTKNFLEVSKQYLEVPKCALTAGKAGEESGEADDRRDQRQRAVGFVSIDEERSENEARTMFK